MNAVDQFDLAGNTFFALLLRQPYVGNSKSIPASKIITLA